MVAKFKLDENIPRDAQNFLVQAGYDTHSVRDEGLAGATDRRVLAACIDEDRILVTLDLDFADIYDYPP